MESQPSNTGNFVKAFESFRDQFVVIGGTATLLHIEQRLALRPRKTDDLDIVVLDISEDNSRSAFLTAFMTYVGHCGYKCDDLSSGKTQAFRYTKPKDPLAPRYLEIATRRSEDVPFPRGTQRLEEFEMSAIVCEPHYVELLKAHRVQMPLNDEQTEVLPIPELCVLVVLKAYAYQNLKDSPSARERGKADKHLRDIIRLAGAMNVSDTLAVSKPAHEPLKELFLSSCSEANLLDAC